MERLSQKLVILFLQLNIEKYKKAASSAETESIIYVKGKSFRLRGKNLIFQVEIGVTFKSCLYINDRVK